MIANRLRSGEALALLAVGFAAFAGPAALLRGGEPKQQPVICIEYAGQWSDKPIAPLVIAPGKPSSDTLRSLFGAGSSTNYFHFFLFPAGEVRDLGGQISRQLKELPSSSATSAVLLVTLAGIPWDSKELGLEPKIDGRKSSRLLSAQHARAILQVLDHFQPVDAGAGKELRDDVATFRMRSQLD